MSDNNRNFDSELNESPMAAPAAEDDVAEKPLKKTRGKQKIKIEYIESKQRRQITFYKRKSGLIKKAHELTTLTGTEVLLLMASETGHVYTYATKDLQPVITRPENQAFIQSCLGQVPGVNTYATNLIGEKHLSEQGLKPDPNFEFKKDYPDPQLDHPPNNQPFSNLEMRDFTGRYGMPDRSLWEGPSGESQNRLQVPRPFKDPYPKYESFKE